MFLSPPRQVCRVTSKVKPSSSAAADGRPTMIAATRLASSCAPMANL
jgi:hypothetical protein